MSPAARSEAAILQATLELVAEHGVTGLTVDAVAARAGVGKQTIYRHWGSRAKLVVAAISCIQGQQGDVEIDTGSVRRDLEVALTGLVSVLSCADTGRVLPSLIEAAERDPELAELRQEHIREKRAVFERILQRGIERGELQPELDLDLVIDLLAGPFFYRRIIGRRAVATGQIEPLVDFVLRAAAIPAVTP